MRGWSLGGWGSPLAGLAFEGGGRIPRPAVVARRASRTFIQRLKSEGFRVLFSFFSLPPCAQTAFPK